MISKESKNVSRKRRHARVRSKVSGTPECPRLCVYRSNKNIEAQLIDDVNRVTLVSSSSMSLKLENGSNIEAASKVGADVAQGQFCRAHIAGHGHLHVGIACKDDETHLVVVE